VSTARTRPHGERAGTPACTPVHRSARLRPPPARGDAALRVSSSGATPSSPPRAARIIPTDGRSHREGIEPSYCGDSVGRWDGDTLVIDTVNFKRWILDDYHYTDPTKTRWHSEDLRTTERLRREGDKLHYQITIDDPQIFTRPFSQDFELTLRPDWEEPGLLEYVCEENNRCPGGNCRPSDVQ
jgi:hypothetical protein